MLPAVQLPLLLAAAASGGRRPPILGYNAYDHVGCCPTEELIHSVAEAMDDNGMLALGYTYVSIDCGWAAKERDNATGEVTWDPAKFPSGIPALARMLHAKGMKLGIYSDRGPGMFKGGPGMYGNEARDALTFAKWGVDLLKVDDMTSHNHTVDAARRDYLAIRSGVAAAESATGNRIHYVTCGHTGNMSYPLGWERSWMGEECSAIADSCRIAEDVRFWGNGTFGSSKAVNIVAELNARGVNGVDGSWADPDCVFSYTAPQTPAGVSCAGGWNDPRPWASVTQFGLWAVMPAPLLVGTNVRNLTAQQRATFLNSEVIAVHQDSLALPGQRVAGGNFTQKGGNWKTDVDGVTSTAVWARELSGGARAVIFLNDGPGRATVTCDSQCFTKMGAAGMGFAVRDLWNRTNLAAIPKGQDTYSVDVFGPGGSALLKFTPQ